jgi:hypothetical protein
MSEEFEFSIDKIDVTARRRKLQAEYTLETAEQLRVMHGPFYSDNIPVDGPISKNLKKYLKVTRWKECKCFCEWFNKPFPKRYSRNQRKLLKQHLDRVQNENRRQDAIIEFGRMLSDAISEEINREILREINNG